MPIYDDHPVRVLMRRANLRRGELSAEAGVTYGALDKLMMGMTKSVHPAIARTLSRHTGVAPERIKQLVAEWNEKPLLEKLPPRGRAMLAFEPGDIGRFYPSWQLWREEFAQNPTQFASLVRMPRASLVEYETGRRRQFPPVLREALIRTFGLSEAYVHALTELPPSDSPGLMAPASARVVELRNPFDDVEPALPPVDVGTILDQYFDQPTPDEEIEDD